MKGVPVPPPGDPFPRRKGDLDELDIEASKATIGGVDEASWFNDGLLVQSRSIV